MKLHCFRSDIFTFLRCYDAQVVGSYRVSNPFRLTFLAAKSEDYASAPQHLQSERSDPVSECFLCSFYREAFYHCTLLLSFFLLRGSTMVIFMMNEMKNRPLSQ